MEADGQTIPGSLYAFLGVSGGTIVGAAFGSTPVIGNTSAVVLLFCPKDGCPDNEEGVITRGGTLLQLLILRL